MTSEDAELSSMALGNDPRGSFIIPLPDEPRITPQISLTAATGQTTTLYP